VERPREILTFCHQNPAKSLEASTHRKVKEIDEGTIKSVAVCEGEILRDL
jgi:hypothetical protein